MSKIYDLVIVGAGIAGCSLAYNCKDKNILLIDRAATPVTGGSGAAGAFISPKLGKKTELLDLTNIAYRYATDFYSRNFKEYFEQSGMVRLAKDETDAKEFEKYKNIVGSGEIIEPKELSKLGIKCEYSALYFNDGGVCDAQELCKALIKGLEFKQLDVKEITKQKDKTFLINREIRAKRVVLTTGYEGFDSLEYMSIAGIWGSRGDFYTSSNIKVNMHKSVSVSSNIDGTIKIGASHVRASSPTKACMQCSGEPLKELIEKAKEIADIKDLKLKETFCGMRANCKDYFPLLGEVIDAKYMLEHYPNIKKGFSKVEFKRVENLYVFNGLGGRGFVFSPMLAMWLKEYIFDAIELDNRVNSDRLFFKWARKLK